jgi:hypothetical protein
VCKRKKGSNSNMVVLSTMCRIPIRKGLFVARATKLRINMKVVLLMLLMLLVSLRGKLVLSNFSINQTRNQQLLQISASGARRLATCRRTVLSG